MLEGGGGSQQGKCWDLSLGWVGNRMLQTTLTGHGGMGGRPVTQYGIRFSSRWSSIKSVKKEDPEGNETDEHKGKKKKRKTMEPEGEREGRENKGGMVRGVKRILENVHKGERSGVCHLFGRSGLWRGGCR